METAEINRIRAETDRTKAETDKTKAETIKTITATISELLKVVGILVSLGLATYANCTKADATKVATAMSGQGESIAALGESVEKQHDQTEKIRETVKGTAKAVKTIASAAPAPAGIPVMDKEPEDRGCWTVYGGMVRCKGLDNASSTAEHDRAATAPAVYMPARVSVPEVPPPAPPPATPAQPDGYSF